ncbi:MAG: T9SS type A sorting domain-containing protein [Saprospiraceae bacterium]
MKRNYILCFVYLMTVSSLSAQDGGGFHDTYQLSDGFGIAFRDISMLGEDTLLVLGHGYYEPYFPDHIVFVLVLDTLGSVLDAKIIRIPEETLLSEALIRRNSNGQYLIAISNFFNGIIAELNTDLTLNLFDNYYGVNGSNVLYPKSILELPDSTIVLAGYYQKQNSFSYNFIKFITPLGIQSFGKSYGIDGQNHLLSSISQNGDSSLVIGASYYDGFFPNEIGWTKSHIYEIDFAGNINWEWESEVNAENGVAGLQKTSDNEWIYLTGTIEEDSSKVYVSTLKAVKRDSLFNLIWEKSLSPRPGKSNRAGWLQSSPDGNWIASGWCKMDTLSEEGNPIYSGFIYKFSSEGDSIWAVYLNPEDSLKGDIYPEKMVVSPSGSVYWVNRYNQSTNPGGTWGWLVKVDKDGCAQTLCNTADLIEVSQKVSPPELVVFPNPAYDYVEVQTEYPGKLELFSMEGKLQYTERISAGNTRVGLNSMPTGVCTVRFVRTNGVIDYKHIIINRR